MLRAPTLASRKIFPHSFGALPRHFLPFLPRALPPLSTYVMAALYSLGDAE